MNATAAAKSLQSCPTLCDPIDSSPPGSPVPGILQARALEWVAISFSKAWKWKVKVKSLSCVWLLATPWTAAYQAPLPMGFSRREYWSGVPLPSPNVNEGSPNCDPGHVAPARPRWLLRGWGCRKQGEQGDGTGPDGWGRRKRVNSVSQRLHLPTHRMLNSLTWNLIFDVQTACSLCCKLVYSLTYPLPPWSSFLRDTEMLSPGFEVLNIRTK